MKITIETTSKPMDYRILVEGTPVDPPAGVTIKDAVQAILLCANLMVQNQMTPIPQQQPKLSDADVLSEKLRMLRDPTKRSG